MLARSDTASISANAEGGTSAAENYSGGICDAGGTSDGKSAVDDGDWFSRAARVLLPAKAGTVLHYETGFDERLCQRYAAGHVKPPAYFFRSLLRTEGGWQWLCAAMEGSNASWWQEIKRARRIASAIDQADQP